jgi:LPS-assembly lipoprotein
MWSSENRAVFGRFSRLALVLAVAGLAAGCFQPMYGEKSLSHGPGLRDTLAAVDVAQINAPSGTSEARLAVELRNALLFEFTGGAATTSPTHRLVIRLASQRQQVIVDLTSARPDVENYGLDASYTLTEIATNKTVVTGSTFARVSYDIPGQTQRFARIRGLRDAETRAAKVIAGQIQTRLASYFVAGT